MSSPIKFSGIKVWQISNWKYHLDRLMSGHTLNCESQIQLYPNSQKRFMLELELKVDQSNPDYLSFSIKVWHCPENSVIVSTRCSILNDNLQLHNTVPVNRRLSQGDQCEFARFVHIDDLILTEDLKLLILVTIEENVSDIHFDGRIDRFAHKWSLLHSAGPLHSYSKTITNIPVAKCEFEWTFEIEKPNDVKITEYYCVPSTSYCGNNFEISGKLYPKGKDGKCHLYFYVQEKMRISGILILKTQKETDDCLAFQLLELKPGYNLIKSFSLALLPAKLTIGFKFKSFGEPVTVPVEEPTVFLTKEWIEKYEIEQIREDDLITDVKLLFPNNRKLYGHSFVLAAHSTKLANIFASSIMERQNGMFQVQVNDVDKICFKNLIHFYYTEEIPTDQLGEFLYAAYQYGQFDAAVNKVLTNCSKIECLVSLLYLLVIALTKNDENLMAKLVDNFFKVQF